MARVAVTRQRLLVIASVIVATSIKLWWAATTNGSNDVHNFHTFANGVAQFGPIGVYGHHMLAAPYNHPPLIGWMLLVMHKLTHHGFAFHLLIRLPAIAADIVSTGLVYALIRRRGTEREATLGAVMFALSPVLLVISGFHGNTDPAFVMFAALSFYLLLSRASTITAALAGVSFAVSISIKLVPVVTIGVLLVVALRSGTRRLLAFGAGAAAVLALLWVPVAVLNWAPFKQNVLGYAGYGGRARWGLPEFGYAAGLSQRWLDLLEGPGRFLVLVLSTAVPMVIAWRRPRATVPAFGLSLAMFLLLTPAYAMQYLAWAVAAAFLIGVWSGIGYSVAAGVLVITVYDRWNGALPWSWNNGRASSMTHRETIMAGFVWLVLAVITVLGLWRSWFRPSRDAAGSAAAPARPPVSRGTAATEESVRIAHVS